MEPLTPGEGQNVAVRAVVGRALLGQGAPAARTETGDRLRDGGRLGTWLGRVGGRRIFQHIS